MPPLAAHGARVRENYVTTPEISVFFFVGRVLFGGFFLYNGVNHFTNTAALATMAGQAGVPAPTFAVYLTGLMLLVGGLSVLVGFLPQVGLALLALFLVGVTPVVHDFWNLADPALRAAQQAHFWKNVGLLGAVFTLLAIPEPWPVSYGRD